VTNLFGHISVWFWSSSQVVYIPLWEKCTHIICTIKPSTFGTQKWKRNVLKFEKKLEIIDKFKKGASAVALSKVLGESWTIINDFKKMSNKIERFAC